MIPDLHITRNHDTGKVTSMTAQTLADKLPAALVTGVYKRGNREFIVTPFSYPCGDSVNIYVIEQDGVVFASDLATTYHALRVGNVKLNTKRRREFAESVCASYDMNMSDDFIFTKTIGDNAAIDVLAYCEGITRISTLSYRRLFSRC